MLFLILAALSAGGPPVLVEPGRAWTYEAALAVGGPPVLVEPGRSWTYVGDCLATDEKRCPSVAGELTDLRPLEVRYVILPRAEGSSETSVVRTLSTAPGEREGKESRPADVAVLRLRSNLIQKSARCRSEAHHPAAPYFDFAPVPPDYGKVLVGSKREDAVKVELPEGTFAPGRVWTASYTEDEMLEVVCRAKALPAKSGANPEVVLEAYRETYRVDPKSGVTVAFERALTVREAETEPRSVTVSLRLKKWEDLTAEELQVEAAAVADE